MPKTNAEMVAAYRARERRGAVTLADVEISAASVNAFVMWGYVPGDVSQRSKPERKALIKQALDRFLNEDLQHLQEPPAPPAEGEPLAALKAEALTH